MKVGIYQPRFSYLPLWLPNIVDLYFEYVYSRHLPLFTVYTDQLCFSYLLTLNLSLFIFNLLCLPFLDGSQLLSAVLDLISELAEPSSEGTLGIEDQDGFAINLEAGSHRWSSARSPSHRFLDVRRNEAGVFFSRWIRRRKRDIERTAMVATLSLMGIALGGGVLMSVVHRN